MPILSGVKRAILNVMPPVVRRLIRRMRQREAHRQFQGQSRQQVFTRIYDERLWGEGTADDSFHSGSGSHDPSVVEPYIKAVCAYMDELGGPDVVDLGCGDFSIGSRIRRHCSSYLACDIVPALIERNRQKYADLDVQFAIIDMVQDPLPPSEVVMIRQVLQHLSNNDVAAVLAKVAATYRVLIITEHLPAGNFVPNLDKPTGPSVRLSCTEPSGLVITEPPFNIPPVTSRLLCEVEEPNLVIPGSLRTTAYQLRV